MTRLLRAELIRLRSRRVTWLLLTLLVLLMLAILLASFLGHHKHPTEAQLRQAHRFYDQAVKEFNQNPEQFGGPDNAPRLEWYLNDPRYQAADIAPTQQGFAVAIAIAFFFLAASFIGSEHHHGLLGNLLVWEPRRVRVLGAKTTVVAVASAVLAFALSILLVLGLWLVAILRGTTHGVSHGYVGSLVQAAGRTSLLVVFVCMLGAVLASVTRSTAAGIGIGLVYLAVLERFLSFARPRWQPWLMGNLSSALVTGKQYFFLPGPVEASNGGLVQQVRPMLVTWSRGTVVLGIYMAILFAFAALDFRRRDIT